VQWIQASRNAAAASGVTLTYEAGAQRHKIS